MGTYTKSRGKPRCGIYFFLTRHLTKCLGYEKKTACIKYKIIII